MKMPIHIKLNDQNMPTAKTDSYVAPCFHLSNNWDETINYIDINNQCQEVAGTSSNSRNHHI
jgi:hypothetical protein